MQDTNFSEDLINKDAKTEEEHRINRRVEFFLIRDEK